MKRLHNRLLSMAAAIAMLGMNLSLAPITAADSYDATVEVVFPRPDAAPQPPVITASTAELELVSYIWQEDSTGYVHMLEHPIMDWMMEMEGFAGYMGNFAAFADTDAYDFSMLCKIDGYAGAANVQGTSVFQDADTGEELCEGNYNVISVSALLSMLGTDTSLPEGLTADDALVTLTADQSFQCSPTDHQHNNTTMTADAEYHWYVCECGAAMRGTRYEHDCYYDTTEPWKVISNPTETTSGLWEKHCHCGYAVDSVVLPPTSEQTIVSTYKELQAALAKGGKQWITLDVDSVTKWTVQTDMEYDNMLVLDDAEADIVLNLNGCGLARETGKYDDALFDIRAGSLRILSLNCSTPTDASNNLHFSSAASDDCVFRVHAGASLRLTNVSAMSPTDEWAYSCPSVISAGNLQIDGGSYNLYDNDFTPSNSAYAMAAIILDGGTAVINGGKIDGKGCGVLVRGDTKLTIWDGTITSWQYSLYQMGNASVTIQSGIIGSDESCQYGLYQDGGISRIYGGNFYGSVAGAYVQSGDIRISDGYFKLTENTGYGAFSYNVTDTAAEIISGEFKGAKCIATRWALFDEETEIRPSEYIAAGSAARTMTAVVDLTEPVTHIGEDELMVYTTKPVFKLQPVDAYLYEGGTAVFKVKTNDPNCTYCWYLTDVWDDSLQPYDWAVVEQFCDVSGIESDTLTITNADRWLGDKMVYCEAYNGQYKFSDTAMFMLTERIRGDVNADGVFGVADVVMLQKWLLAVPDATLTAPEAADLTADGKVNGFDLSVMKRELLA